MSTSTTWGRRRAITKPANVTNIVSANVHNAEGSTSEAASSLDSNRCTPSRTRSRSKVNTNSDEKNPMDRTPTQARRSVSAGLRKESFRTASGITTQQTTSSAIPANAPKGPTDNAGSSRQQMYAGSERTSHKGFKNRRRTVTFPLWGRCAASSRPAHGFAQRFHPPEFDELGRGCPQIIPVEEGLE